MSTTTLTPLATLKGRLAAAYKDNLMIDPTSIRIYAEGDDLIHEARVTATDPEDLEPRRVHVREHITADGSHLQIHCTCKGGDEFGLACKHAALTLEAAGLLHEGWEYTVLSGEEWKEVNDGEAPQDRR